jgi:hypothetical protein
MKELKETTVLLSQVVVRLKAMLREVDTLLYVVELAKQQEEKKNKIKEKSYKLLLEAMFVK